MIERIQGFVCSCIHGLLVACSMSWMAAESVKATAGGHYVRWLMLTPIVISTAVQEVVTLHALCEQIAHHREQNDEDRRYSAEPR